MALLSTSQPVIHNRFGLRTSLIAVAALIGPLYYGRDFFVTLLISAILAFILDPAVLLVMRLRLPHPAATLVVLGFTFVLLYFLGVVAWTQVSSLSEDLPTYSSHANELWRSPGLLARKLEISSRHTDVCLI